MDANSDGKGLKRDKREEKKRLGRNAAYAKAAWEKYDRAVEARWAELRSGRSSVLTSIHIQALAGEIHRGWLNLAREVLPNSALRAQLNIRYEGQPGKHMLALSSSQFDLRRTFDRNGLV